MTHALAVLLRSLQRAGLDIDAEGALDSLWLGSEIRDKARTGSAASPRPSAEVIAPPDTTTTPAPRTEDGERRPSTETRRRDTLSARTAEFATPAAASGADPTAAARTLTLARAAALPGSRDLIKALRPLRRRVVSPGAGVLDIDATVRRAAEEDLWFPSFASARERWLDVMLIADHGLSMIFWKDTIDEFERVLRNSGAFRSVRSWWLESDADAPAITARGRGPVPSTADGLSRLTRGGGRSVVLVISDCVGTRWHDGAIPRLIAGWSRALPVALMQVTPEWFWARTALGDTVGSRLRSAVPAAVNHRFQWDTTALGAGGVSPEEEQTLLRMPAATLTGDAVARLSGLIAGVGREWAPGVVFDLTWSSGDEPEAAPALTAEDRVARFRGLASTAALRLAAAFSASPVRTLGVLRLLRRDLLPDASPFCEAEVLLGGIVRVKRDEARWDLGASLPLEFPPGVQRLLLDGAVAGDVLRVLRHAAAVAQTGVGPTFVSWLENPSSGAGQLDAADSPFAAAAAKVLQRLGGAYAQMVKPSVVAVPEQQTAGDTAPPSAPVGEPYSASSVGQPHALPYPGALYGRDDALQRIDRWFLEWSDRRPLSIAGPQGIGKTALAAHAIVRWRNMWSGDEPFVWCFRVEPWSRDMLRRLREHYTGAPVFEGLETDEELLEAVSHRRNSLVIFDDLDAIQDGFEAQRVLEIAGKIANAGVHVLVTRRATTADLTPTDILTLGPLDERVSESFVNDLLAAPGAPAVSDEEKTMVVAATRAWAAGNPLAIRSLIGRLADLPAEIFYHELDPARSDPSRLAQHNLPDILDQLDRAARAWKRSAMGTLLLEAGSMSEALAAFDDVVESRSGSPSEFLKGVAFLDRGRARLALSDVAAAAADIADAVRLFIKVDARPDLVRALETLAEVQAATMRYEDAIESLRQAADVARADNDSVATERILVRLTMLQTLRGGADVLEGDDDRILTVEFLISGRVQGVGFRAFAERCFREIGLESGNVANLANGQVRVRAAGPRQRLRQLQERVRRGPTAANVEHVVTTIVDDGTSPAEVAETTSTHGATAAADRVPTPDSRRAVIAIGINRTNDQLPGLPAAADAARRIAEWAVSSQHIVEDRVTLLTDEDRPVSTRRIVDAILNAGQSGPTTQLIVYFAGYSANAGRSECWLTAQAPNDASGSLSVARIKELTRYSGIPHVVFVADTCRVSFPVQTVTADAAMPRRPTTIRGVVDQFSAMTVANVSREVFGIGDPSRESGDAADAAGQYQAAYTTALLSALTGDETAIQEERDGVLFVRPRALASYLEKAVPKYLAAAGVPFDIRHAPEARIESGDEAWLARFE